jgi:4-amino-4-deoxy-L-arabinose transferase-like glycosyltransferase
MFGSSRLVLRSPSVVFGVATVPVVAELGRKVRSVRVGLLGASLFAISLPLVAWQQIARAYTLGILLISLAVLSWLSLARRPRISSALCYVVITTVASYCLLINWWVMIGEAIWGLALFVSWRESPATRTRTAWLGASLCVAVLCNLGLAEIAMRTGFGQLVPARNEVSLAAAAHTILVLTSSADGLRQPSWAILGGGLALVTASLWVCSLWRHPVGTRPDSWRNEGSCTTWLLAAWLVVPVLVAAVSSVVLHPIFKPRYFLVCLPPSALLAACGLERLARRGVLIYTGCVSLLLAAHLAFLSRLWVS